MSRRSGDAQPPATTVPPAHFDRIYSEESDPWGFTRRWYERRKYAITVACLPRERYRSAFEAGCSIGEMTTLLAPRCDQLLAVDCSRLAVERATRALADQPHR